MWFKRRQKNRRFSRRHVLDVKQRSDRVRATRVRLAVTAAGLLFGTVFGLYLLWRTGEWALDRFVYENPAFAIQRIDVQSDGVIAPERLRRWTGVKPGANLIALDLADVKRNLELVPAIASVSVERVLPHTLKIRVTERRPIAQVNVPLATASGGIAVSVFKLDAAGYVMQPLDPRRGVVPLSQAGAQLPVITGLNLFQLQPGHRVGLPQALAALKLVAAFHHSPMAGLVDLQRLDVSSPQVIVVTTARGSKITFGPDHLAEQLRRWRAIYDLGQRLNRNIASADLAVENNIPVRWTERQLPPAASDDSNAAPTRRKNV